LCKRIKFNWNKLKWFLYSAASSIGKGFFRISLKALLAKTFRLSPQICNRKSKIVNPLKSLFLAVYSGFNKNLIQEKILLQSKSFYICRSIKFKKNYHEQS
jgi:hypothetical protein